MISYLSVRIPLYVSLPLAYGGGWWRTTRCERLRFIRENHHCTLRQVRDSQYQNLNFEFLLKRILLLSLFKVYIIHNNRRHVLWIYNNSHILIPPIELDLLVIYFWLK